MNLEISKRIRVLNFIMTCFMVLYHCPVLDGSQAINAYDLRISEFLCNFVSAMGLLVMCYFFTVSGFLLFRDLSMSNYLEKMKRRIFSLLIPYLAWQVVIAVIDAFQEKRVLTLSTYLVRTFALVKWPIDGPLWYVYAIFLLALLSPVMILAFRNRRTAQIFVLVMVFLPTIMKHSSNPLISRIWGYGYMSNILRYMPSYMVGAFYGKFENSTTKTEAFSYLTVILLCAFAFNEIIADTLTGLIVRMLPILMVYSLPVIKAFENRRVYCLTFLIYAIHQPLIADIYPAVKELIIRAHMPVTLYNIAGWLCILAADLCISAGLYAVLKKKAPNALNILTGGRN